MSLEPGRPIGRGVLLLPAEPWRRFCCGLDGVVLEGAGDLAFLGEGLSGESIFDRLAPDGVEKLRAFMADPRGTNLSGYVTTRSQVPLEFLLIPRPGGFEIFLRTVENRVETMEDLAVFYRSFISGPNAMVFTDVDGTILDVNRKFLDLYGYQLDEVIGATPRLVKSGKQPEEFYESLWKGIQDPNQGHWSGEVVNRRKDGTEVVVSLTVASVRNQEGTTVGYVGHVVDITQRRQMEWEIEEKNRELVALNALKNEFVAVTSHDLKAPLDSIIAYAELLRGDLSPGTAAPSLRFLDLIIDSSRQMAGFIQHLLDIDRINAEGFRIRPEPTRLAEVIEACVELNRSTALFHGLSLKAGVEGQPDPVLADRQKMEQVLNNLLSNAIKFSPPGTEVEVIYRALPGDAREIEVADRGPGIPEEDLESIFDHYYQVKKRGAIARRAFGTGVGLGLAICKRLVDLHGGTVTAENREGGGCRFRIMIPARAGDPELLASSQDGFPQDHDDANHGNEVKR